MNYLNDEIRRYFSVSSPKDRYRNFAGKIASASITRLLQNELIKTLRLKGEVFDFGGGEKSQYREMLNCSSYASANIDPAIEPTYLSSAGSALDVETAAFDTVISFNTLEHIYDARFVVSELSRVLKQGGEIYLTTPFLYPIHGHPDDYFRPTPSWYKQTLEDFGFRNVDVIPLYWGPLTTAQVCSRMPGPFVTIRRRLALFLDYWFNRIREGLNRQDADETELYKMRLATGFFVSAVKA